MIGMLRTIFWLKGFKGLLYAISQETRHICIALPERAASLDLFPGAARGPAGY